MSTWEERRRRSLGYYACLILLIWPLLLIPIEILFSAIYLGIYALVLSVLYATAVIVLVFGLGAKYRYRGINPSTRNVINVNDGHYFERIGPDESDYP
jgi:hypothetical protein